VHIAVVAVVVAFEVAQFDAVDLKVVENVVETVDQIEVGCCLVVGFEIIEAPVAVIASD
jgi:hypothetical protein